MRYILSIAIVLGSISTANANALTEAEQSVKREFRFFRIQVYNTFRQLRPEYDGRRQAGEAALTAWKQAGGQAHQAETLAQWYREAKAASKPGAVAALPPLPEFPKAVAVQPSAKPEPIVNRSETNWRTPEGGNYRVREVASRSVDHPENVPGEVNKREKKKKKSNNVWASVSRALLKSLPLGDSGDEDK